MENKQQGLQVSMPSDTHIKDILNSPLKTTPAVPTPDWGASATPTPV